MSHSLDPIFRPRSIAVIGASRQPSSIGRELLRNILDGGFRGKVFPVNPHAEAIHSIKCYARVTDIPDEVDLAIIVVPRDLVLGVVDECGQKGVKGLVVITAGFRETGQQGAALEEQLRAKARDYGMRLVGPNCMGVINTEAGVALNGTFAPTQALPGQTSFMSQSGAFGVAILNIAERLNLGLSMFASVGNKADVSGNDLLEYWEDDPNTRLILLYLESFGNPKRFTQLARRITKSKPIVVVKAGRTALGARAAGSHTGALAEADVAIDTLLAQCGVQRASSVEELFDLAMALASCPLPRENRVGIVSNGGGPAIMATDACLSLGLRLAELSPATRAGLQDFLPPEASANNPVDLIASATRDSYGRALELMLRDEAVDSAMVIFVPPIMIDPTDIAETVAQVAARHAKPVVGVFMARDEFFSRVRQRLAHPIPLYLFPESAAKALAALDRQRRWRGRAAGEVVSFPVNREVAQSVLDGVRDEGRLELTAPEALTVLDAYGISIPRFGFARTLEEALATAHGLSYPVVMKLLSKQVSHKTDIGGVITDVRNADELTSNFLTLLGRAQRHGVPLDGILIQEMIKGGREVAMGMSYEPRLGPLLMFGLGGVYLEALRDVNFKVWPLTDIDARELIQSLRALPILRGIRGEAPVAFALLEETLLRLSQLVGDFDAFAEIDLNPFIVSADPARSKAVDARMLLRG